MKAFCPIYRISRRALIGLHELMSDGWRGHAEVVIPSAVNYHKYSMADMGVVEENSIRQKVFYNKQTMSHLKLTVNVELADMLYHPIKNPPYS
ncbi:MAG: hypothetical protein MJY95_01370 [Bacteroidaceae bacterium]|nr:hypothetical protein [Bacteroidaceae bacterium]